MRNFNLLSALQQAKNSVTSNAVKANGQTKNYLRNAKEMIKGLLTPVQGNTRPANNVPPALMETFQKATEGFTPAAMTRAQNIPIKYTPLTSNVYPQLLIGAGKVLGAIPNGAAGIYDSFGNGGRELSSITIGTKYAEDPEVLRHELIHSMDTNMNYVGRSRLPWKDKNGVEYTDEQHQQSADANTKLYDVSPLQRYMNGTGVLDSRGFYPSINNQGKDYVYDRTSGPLYRFEDYPADPRMLDTEGIAYMGTTGEEYSMPQYQSAIQEAIRAAKYPPNTSFAKSSRFLPNGIGAKINKAKLRPENHIPGMN